MQVPDMHSSAAHGTGVAAAVTGTAEEQDPDAQARGFIQRFRVSRKKGVGGGTACAWSKHGVWGQRLGSV